jgi:hypothetical protein
MKPLFAALVLTLAAAFAQAGDCCQHCGCQDSCNKACRLVCETTKVPKVTYECACEDFCVPGPSEKCTVCDECGNKQHIYTPTCAEIRTRKKLIKKETFTEKKSYKWVVEDLCCKCAEQAASETAANEQALARPQTAPPARPAAPREDGAARANFMPPTEQEPAKFDLRRVLLGDRGK